MRVFHWLLIAMLFVGCASPDKVEVSDQDRSLGEIGRAIRGVMGEPRKMSENGREFYSPYFSRVPSDKFDPNTSKERLSSRFTILGDRRPYSVDIEVFVEKRVGKEYKLVGTDKKLALQLRKELKDKLALSQGSLNIIDDFRAF